MGFKYLLVLVLLFALLNPTEAWSLRKKLRKIGNKIKEAVKNVGSGVKNIVKNVGGVIKDIKCKILYRLVCPRVPPLPWPTRMVLGAGAGATGALVAGPKVVPPFGCRVENGVAVLAFSDDFSDYDMNGDKRIEYEEFVFTVMKSVGLADPLELREPFKFADMNLDGELNMQEFNGAPFLFAHANSHQHKKEDTPETTPSLEVSTAA
ncbi:hypothetical protein MAR_018451 [Mya arenaria]|uniref:Uncharacterized protein n=1 Tax=Mya arenaria TaxID=6604 RepID=A0ABY7EER2_MYAAR|nr:hypothetical protein MAR_018451 [Mya arenaria]